MMTTRSGAWFKIKACYCRIEPAADTPEGLSRMRVREVEFGLRNLIAVLERLASRPCITKSDKCRAKRICVGTDPLRVDEDAYGNLINRKDNGMLFTVADARTSILYSGEQTDANGMQYLRARYYDPSNGRFNRLDPFAGNASDPQSLHKYLYAHANPVMNVDPSGLFSIVSFTAGQGISTLLNDLTLTAGESVAAALGFQGATFDPASFVFNKTFEVVTRCQSAWRQSVCVWTKRSGQKSRQGSRQDLPEWNSTWSACEYPTPECHDFLAGRGRVRMVASNCCALTAASR